MFLYIVKAKKILIIVICLAIIISVFFMFFSTTFQKSIAVSTNAEGKKYIKWVSFNVTYPALKKAMDLDISSHNKDGYKYNWIEILAFLGAKYGGNFDRYKEKDMDEFVKRLSDGEKIEDITKDKKYYSYYLEAYTAVLGGFLGNYNIQVLDENGNLTWQEKYGLKVFLPIAQGYYYNDYDDFGSGRDYGYKRKHLGHDMFGSIGTPIVAVESGVVEELGWNAYGGWRIGIRSFDTKRYYYYAHLKKDKPYVQGLAKGQVVKAGDVIGYLGKTGYSTTENVNNLEKSHLHFGTQLIFDKSQKDGINQIWIDEYAIINLLTKNKSKVQKVQGTTDFKRTYDFSEQSIEMYWK